MNLRLPLSRMGNRTSIEVQTAAYKKHVSQQWCWFYVSDDYDTAVLILDYTGLPLVMIPAMIC